LLQTLAGIAAAQSSIHAFAPKFEAGLSARQMRYHLAKFDLGAIERLLNQGLQHYVPEAFRHSKSALKLAIDFHDHPYHGEPGQDATEICRGKAKSGTTHFHTYATVYCIKQGKRYTLALKFVRNYMSLVEVLQALLAEVHALGLPIKRLFLDREFFTVEVITFLQHQAIPFIMPAVARGRKGADGKSRLERLCSGHRSYITDYTLKSKKDGVTMTATFKLYIVVKRHKRKNKQFQQEYFMFCLPDDQFPIDRLFTEYRLRFGIESSYKKKNESLCRTSSRSAMLRLLYTGLSLFLINTWIFLQWEFLSQKRRGRRRLLTRECIYERFCELIFNALKPIFKFRPQIICSAESPSSIAVLT
jgi:putative transposase